MTPLSSENAEVRDWTSSRISCVSEVTEGVGNVMEKWEFLFRVLLEKREKNRIEAAK